MNDPCANHASLRLLAPTFLAVECSASVFFGPRIQKRRKKTAARGIRPDELKSDDGVGSDVEQVKNKIEEIRQNLFFSLTARGRKAARPFRNN